MRYLNENDVTQMMGIGYVGEVRQGPDGNVYQYVQGVDGLGNPVGGFWSKLKRGLRTVHRLAQRGAQFIPGPYGAAISAGLKFATPLLQKAGVAGYGGIGALYEAPDGNLYQLQGLEADDELQGIDEDEISQMMGVGYLGEVRQGPDGYPYQYVQGVDGLGNPVGSWWKRLARRALPLLQKFAPLIPGGAVAAGLKVAAPYLRKVLPVARQVASAIPGGAAAMTAAAPILQEAGIEGYAGLGAFYQAPDGSLYQQVQGFEDDAELQGLEADDELQGIDEDPELSGFDEDEELRGIDDDAELSGFESDQEMQGMEGYVRQDGMNGLEAFVPQEPPQTRWHTRPNLSPEVWKPLW